MTPDAIKLREIAALELNAKAALIANRAILPQDLAAVYCGITEKWLCEKARVLEIPAQKNGRLWYFRKSDLDWWMSGSEEIQPRQPARRAKYGAGILPVAIKPIKPIQPKERL